MPYNTGNPIGSTDPRDLSDNAENLDKWLLTQSDESLPDRLGNQRKTWYGMEQDFQDFLISSGYVEVGPYAAGIDITARNQVITDGGSVWRLSASESLPYTTTGAGMPEGGAFVNIGEALLRQQLASSSVGEGASLVTRENGDDLEVDAQAQDAEISALQSGLSTANTNIADLSNEVDGRVIRAGSVSEVEDISSPQAGWQVSLAGVDKPGVFEFDSSDLSAEVAADTDQLTYIAPDGEDGSSGAWVYQSVSVAIPSPDPSNAGSVSEIDTSGLTYFGNMTNQEGLSGIFDTSNESTRGHSGAPDGYAGATLSSPTAIGQVQLRSWSNGFDGSGLTGVVKISLFGKTGSAPASATDGTQIGFRAIQDINSYNTLTVQSRDKSQLFDHVWFLIENEDASTVAICSGFWIYETGTPAVLSSTNPTTLQRSCNQLDVLPQDRGDISAFNTEFYSPAEGSFDLDFSINVTHRGDLLPSSYTGAVGIGGAIYYKYAATYAGLDAESWVRLPVSASNGINIDERNPAHYANVSMMTGLPAQKGYYRFGIQMSGHSDGTVQDYIAAVLAESGKGLNGFRIRYTPSGQFISLG